MKAGRHRPTQSLAVLSGMRQASRFSPAESRVRTPRKRPASPPLRGPLAWSDPAPRSATRNRHRDAPVPEASPADPSRTGPSGPVARPAPHRSRGGGRPPAVSPGLLARPRRSHLANLHRDRPAAPSGILPHGAVLHRQSLLVVGGDAGIQPGAEHFRRFPCLAKNAIAILLSEMPVWRAFQRSSPAWPNTFLFGHAGFIIRQVAPASGGSSTASTPQGWPSVPGHAAAAPSDSRTSWRHITGRCGSAS